MNRPDAIQWRQLLDATGQKLLGLPLQKAQALLSYDTYWNAYGSQHAEHVHARVSADLRDWSATVLCDGAGSFRIICCPEDKVCGHRCPPDEICLACQAPVCSCCWAKLADHESLPPEALAHDMLIFYPPKQIYEQDVTFMELICASPCFTSMTCFSLEKKRLADRALDQDAFMPRNRLVARGNATTFPLPWEDLYT